MLKRLVLNNQCEGRVKITTGTKVMANDALPLLVYHFPALIKLNHFLQTPGLSALPGPNTSDSSTGQCVNLRKLQLKIIF